jgi:prepilin-type processing-associated H-X9-DG protein
MFRLEKRLVILFRDRRKLLLSPQINFVFSTKQNYTNTKMFLENTLSEQSKANVVFRDGHVESPTLQFLFEDTSDAALARWNRDHLPHREKLSP